MARPRKPTSVLRLTGAFKNHPERERDRENEPVVTEPLGEPPDKLDEAQAARWNEFAGWCPWLTVADRFVTEMACRLVMKIRNGEAKAPEYAILRGYLSDLGMTPVARSKVKVPGKLERKNAFKELA
ncbi:MAG TPA: hypothetical protein VJS20_08470 [Gemmatimonadales bacterium]|nr:hypothetical protein [Gemmatimonadales bacterium]